MNTPSRPSGDAHWTRRMPEKLRRGPEAQGAKLSADDIAEICRLHAAGANQSWLGRRFGVSRQTIGRNLKRKDV